MPRREAVATDDPATAPFLFTHLRVTRVTQTSENQSQTEQPEAAAPVKQKTRSSVVALAIFALGINTSAAIYTFSPELAQQNLASLQNLGNSLPDFSRVAELIPQPSRASDSKPAAPAVTLKDIQSAQLQHVAALQENNTLLQHNAALLQQDSISLASLRQSVVDEQTIEKKISSQIADEHEDVKKISAKISTLIAKVDTLQSSIAPEVTSSISAKRAQNRLSKAARKKMVQQPKALGPVSLGGAPLTLPASATTPES